MKHLLCTLFFLAGTLLASELQLKDKLAEARAGSYLVLEQNKTFTFLYIHERSANTIVIEEVSVPSSSFARNPMNWKVWFENGAPGHTAWIMSRINLNTGALEGAYSFTHQGFLDMSGSNSFLTTLLNLRFQELSQADRRKIGLPPGYNKVDRRPIWNPRLIVEGRIIPNVPFQAYKARWPSDGSDLSRKVVEIYLPAPLANDPNAIYYPSYFPYWLEVEGKIGSAKVRVVDSGIDAHSPKGLLPQL